MVKARYALIHVCSYVYKFDKRTSGRTFVAFLIAVKCLKHVLFTHTLIQSNTVAYLPTREENKYILMLTVHSELYNHWLLCLNEVKCMSFSEDSELCDSEYTINARSSRNIHVHMYTPLIGTYICRCDIILQSFME